MTRLAITAALVGAAGVVAPHAAIADTKADALFNKGKKLLAQKKYADACDAFERSNKIDPAIGTELNIARCYEDWGKLAMAFRHYSEAEQMAKASKDKRTPKIHERVTRLDTLVPRLTVRVPSGADTEHADITVDGKPFDPDQLGVAQLVDPGPHQIEYRAGDAKKSKVVPVERGGSSDVTLELAKPAPKQAPAKPTTGPEPVEAPAKVEVAHAEENPGHGRRVLGVVVGAAGLVTMGAAGYLTLSARSSYNDALSAHCGGDKAMCDPDGLTLTHDARSKANLATIVVGAGAAVTVLGVILYVTAPSSQPSGEHALRVTPSAGADHVGLVLDGRF